MAQDLYGSDTSTDSDSYYQNAPSEEEQLSLVLHDENANMSNLSRRSVERVSPKRNDSQITKEIQRLQVELTEIKEENNMLQEKSEYLQNEYEDIQCEVCHNVHHIQ